MSTKYKFVCSSCNFECISSIGAEVGSNYLVVAMACSSCATIDSYTLAKPGSINSELNAKPICQTCHSGDCLSVWDGLTCPHCSNHMRALGSPVGTRRPFKYW